jgi:hypothetical protein
MEKKPQVALVPLLAAEGEVVRRFFFYWPDLCNLVGWREPLATRNELAMGEVVQRFG